MSERMSRPPDPSRYDQEWEIVHHRGSQECTERLRISEGWLYRTRVRNGAHEPDSLAMTFIPDEGG
jgi:hypothetical protein